VAVLEATNRLGGRIWSVVPPGAPHLVAEFGGMRYLKTQAIVPRLVDVLGLPSVPFSKGNANNLNYLRGSRFSVAQYSDPAVVPYRLPASEVGQSPAELMLRGVQAYVPGAETLTPRQWNHVKKTATFHGQPLYDQGFWNLLQLALSPEGYDYVADGIAYPCIFENWNAAEMLQFVAGDFAPGAAYSTIAGGYQRLPDTLAAMARRAGASVHLGAKVVSLAPGGGGAVRLRVAGPGGAVRSVRARWVVLTLPSDPMDALVTRSPFLQEPSFTGALASVGTAPASKQFFTFSTPWWRQLGISGGYSVTDLPLLRCWYFGTEGEQPGADPSNTTSLLMTYNDLSPTGYWAGYSSSRTFSGPPAPRTAPPDLVADAVSQLSELHGIAVPRPRWSAAINWENLPYGNGFHFWEVHARSWEVIPHLRRPFDGVGLSVCGDCWSPVQNWIESGLTTTEGLLQDTFGYRPPPWLPPGQGIVT
jgi:monoamine oxidase